LSTFRARAEVKEHLSVSEQFKRLDHASGVIAVPSPKKLNRRNHLRSRDFANAGWTAISLIDEIPSGRGFFGSFLDGRRDYWRAVGCEMTYQKVHSMPNSFPSESVLSPALCRFLLDRLDNLGRRLS
jgi:hypothetical protein